MPLGLFQAAPLAGSSMVTYLIWAHLSPMVLSIVAGYLLGAIPVAHLVCRLRGVDIQALGTGNPGAANVFRTVGRPLGVLVAMGDGAKGALAVLVGTWLGLPEGLSLLPGAAAVVGHWHSPFLHFRGGAGLATAIGVGLGGLPVPAAIGLVVGLAVTALRKNVGLGAGFGFPAFLMAGLALREPVPVVLGITLLGVIILARSLLLGRR